MKRQVLKLRSVIFDNLTIRQTIFKNTFWLAVGSGLSKFFKAVLLIYAAKILGASQYGEFTFAFSFVSLLVIFHDFGLPTIITREFSGNKKNEGDFASVNSLKIILSIISLIIVCLGSFFITPNPEIRKIIFILALFSITNGFASIFYAFFRAKQRMEYQSWFESLQTLVTTAIGFYILFNLPSSLNLGYAYLISAIIAVVFLAIFFSLKLIPLKISWNIAVWKKFLTMSWPLAFVGLFGVLYTFTDSVMMGYFGLIKETGFYGAAQKVTIVALMPMGLISSSFFPVLSNFFRESSEKMQKLWDGEMNIMIFLSVPLVIGGIVLAPRIISFLYPDDFSASVLALQILISMVGLVFLYQPFYDALIASNKQKMIFWTTLIGALCNIILNFILIPRFSLYGAAIATVITYFILLLISFLFTKKFTPIKPLKFKFLASFLISILSGGFMYFIIKQPEVYSLNIFFSSTIGVIAYSVLLFLLLRLTKPIYEKI
jgi:O-antigen/teichoic acid export membrane protein